MSASAHVVNDADLFQIALLVDKLRHDDINHRIAAISSIGSIASALGTERTREELIPFLTESMDDEADVLLTIADKLSDLIKYVGGREYVHFLLVPLEFLVMNEVMAIREAAINSIELCVDSMTPEHITKYYVSFILRLV
jgi:serine/threonine-protein phosphatase 2A regulatory subunit A